MKVALGERFWSHVDKKMRRLSAQGATNKDLARHYELDPSSVSRIVNRKTYREVPDMTYQRAEHSLAEAVV